MFLPIAVLAMTALIGCSTLAGSDLTVPEVVRMAHDEQHPAHGFEDVAGICLARATPDGMPRFFDGMDSAQEERGTQLGHNPPTPLARRPSLLDSMQARALGCLD